MKKKLLFIGSVVALLTACHSGNKPTENNVGETTAVSSQDSQCWPKLDEEGNYIRQEGDPMFLVSDKFRKQFVHPTAANDTINNAPEYSKFVWKDFVLKIASGEFLCGTIEGTYAPEEFTSMRGPLFVPIDQDESVRLSKQLNTQWFDLMPVAFTEKSLEARQVLSFTDKKSWNDIRKMEDSLQAKVAEKYGLEIENTEWIASINSNSINLYQVQFKPKDNQVIAAVIAFKEDGTFITNDEVLKLGNGQQWNVDDNDNLKNAPMIACVSQTETQTEIYYIERAPESISTGIYIINENGLNKIRMNDWYVKQ